MSNIHCRRCKAEIEPGKHFKGSEELIGSRKYRMRWDLCRMCDDLLRRFMDGERLRGE